MRDSGEFLGEYLSSRSLKSALDPMGALERVNAAMRSPLDSVALQPPKINLEALTPPRFPTHQEVNAYQSSDAIVESMADTVKQWRQQLPEGYQPIVIALLQGDIQLQVERLAAESFHCIRFEGVLANTGAPCMLLAHQASIQLLCTVVEITEEKPERKIGFVIDDELQNL